MGEGGCVPNPSCDYQTTHSGHLSRHLKSRVCVYCTSGCGMRFNDHETFDEARAARDAHEKAAETVPCAPAPLSKNKTFRTDCDECDGDCKGHFESLRILPRPLKAHNDRWIFFDYETLAWALAVKLETGEKGQVKRVGGEHLPKHLDWWVSPALSAQISGMPLPPGVEKVQADTRSIDAAIDALVQKGTAADDLQLVKLRDRQAFARNATQFCTAFDPSLGHDGVGHHITAVFKRWLDAVEQWLGRHVGSGYGERSWEERAAWYARCELLREWYCVEHLGWKRAAYNKWIKGKKLSFKLSFEATKIAPLLDGVGMRLDAQLNVGVGIHPKDETWVTGPTFGTLLQPGQPTEDGDDESEESAEDLSTLKVGELRARLRERGESEKGRKAELVARLEQAMEADADLAAEEEEKSAEPDDDVEPAAERPVPAAAPALDGLALAQSLRRFLDTSRSRKKSDKMIEGKLAAFRSDHAVVCLSFNGRRFDTEYIARGFVDANAVEDITVLPAKGLLDVTYRKMWHFRDARAQTSGSLAGVAKDFGEGANSGSELKGEYPHEWYGDTVAIFSSADDIVECVETDGGVLYKVNGVELTPCALPDDATAIPLCIGVAVGAVGDEWMNAGTYYELLDGDASIYVRNTSLFGRENWFDFSTRAWRADFETDCPARHKWTNENLKHKPPRSFFKAKGAGGLDVQISLAAYKTIPGKDPQGDAHGDGFYNPREECKAYCSKDNRVGALSVWQPWRESIIEMTRYTGEDEVHVPIASLPCHVLSLDPGTSNLGYCFLRCEEGGAIHLVAAGTLRDCQVDAAADRVRGLHSVKLVLKEGQLPLHVLIELQAAGRSGRELANQRAQMAALERGFPGAHRIDARYKFHLDATLARPLRPSWRTPTHEENKAWAVKAAAQLSAKHGLDAAAFRSNHAADALLQALWWIGEHTASTDQCVPCDEGDGATPCCPACTALFSTAGADPNNHVTNANLWMACAKTALICDGEPEVAMDGVVKGEDGEIVFEGVEVVKTSFRTRGRFIPDEGLQVLPQSQDLFSREGIKGGWIEAPTPVAVVEDDAAVCLCQPDLPSKCPECEGAVVGCELDVLDETVAGFQCTSCVWSRPKWDPACGVTCGKVGCKGRVHRKAEASPLLGADYVCETLCCDGCGACVDPSQAERRITLRQEQEDVNAMYSWGMHQPLPMPGTGEWWSRERLDAMNLDAFGSIMRGKIFLIECDLAVSKANTVPMAGEHVDDPRFPKPVRKPGDAKPSLLAWTCHDKQRLISWSPSLMAELAQGGRITHIYRLLEFEGSPWLKPWVSFCVAVKEKQDTYKNGESPLYNPTLRKAAKDGGNTICGATMSRLRFEKTSTVSYEKKVELLSQPKWRRLLARDPLPLSDNWWVLTFRKKWRPSVAALPSCGGSYVLDICKPHLIAGQRAMEKAGGIISYKDTDSVSALMPHGAEMDPALRHPTKTGFFDPEYGEYTKRGQAVAALKAYGLWAVYGHAEHLQSAIGALEMTLVNAGAADCAAERTLLAALEQAEAATRDLPPFARDKALGETLDRLRTLVYTVARSNKVEGTTKALDKLGGPQWGKLKGASKGANLERTNFRAYEKTAKGAPLLLDKMQTDGAAYTSNTKMPGEGKRFNTLPFKLRPPPPERAKRKALPIEIRDGVKLMRTEPHGYIKRPQTGAQLTLIASEQKLTLSANVTALASAARIDWSQIDLEPAEMARIEAAWRRACATPVARFACTPIGLGMLKRRWAILHPPMEQ